MPAYFCIECGHPTEHLNIKAAAEHCDVTRATIYNWIHRGLVHCVIQPAGRKFICTESLLVPGFTVYSPSWAEADSWGGGRDGLRRTPRPPAAGRHPVAVVGMRR